MAEEDDYLSMSFTDPPAPKETSLQRTARLKREAAERARVPSKKERLEQAKATRDAVLTTQLDSSNKGAQMMAKMGFKGGALGKSEGARTQPIEVQIKHDRGGIGIDSEKKRKLQELAEQGEKRQKMGVEEYRERNRLEQEAGRIERQMWGAMKVLEKLDGDQETENPGPKAPTSVDDDGIAASITTNSTKSTSLRDVNVLYRPLLKRTLEKERERQMRYEVNNSLSTRNDVEPEGKQEVVFDHRISQLDDEDPELADFEALPSAERLEKVVAELRSKHRYCYWCKFRYEDEKMEGCPGLTEDDHD